MKACHFICLFIACQIGVAAAFSLSSISHSRTQTSSSFTRLNKLELQAQPTDESNDEGFLSNLTINLNYAIPYAVFFALGGYCSATEPMGASNDIIMQFIADPINPGTGSSVFEAVFNTLGLIGVPMACLLMPGNKSKEVPQKFSAAPFLFGSAAAGYGSLGLYMMTRKPVPSIDSDDLGWFTKNVLENKIFNVVVVAAFANIWITTGAAVDIATDASGAITAFIHFISGSALGFVSSVDLLILCLTGASLVPEDLARRGVDVDGEDKGKALAIAASTLLVPALGLAVYAALRPSLDDEA
mmetsp:Transcript_27071/g.40051  ORF Transcript_27071/g.40051 Transcript_27071/m.40051 type:complete len:300 (-) Transcript_27071:126-1025(-)